MDRYFAAMGADEDYSAFFDEDVTFLMVDNGQEVRGPSVVREYINDLHEKIRSQTQHDLVVTDGHAYLESHSVIAESETTPVLAFCLVYDVGADRITAMRCYGTLAELSPPTA
jgi:hypothetical protein